MKLISLVLVLFISFQSHSQVNNKERSDTTQVNRLLEQGKKAQWIDSYQSLNFAEQALIQALHGNYKKGIAAAHNLKGFCYWTFGDNDLAVQSAMEALQVEDNFPVLQAESYYILARGYMDLGETQKARESILKSEKLAEGEKNWEQLSSIYNLKG